MSSKDSHEPALSYLRYEPNPLLHLNVWPFMCGLFAWVVTWKMTFNSSQTWELVVVAAVTLTIAAVFTMLCYWRLEFRVRAQYKQVNVISNATHVFVKPSVPEYHSCLCQLRKNKDEKIWFDYQKSFYHLDENTGQFVRPRYPDGLLIDEYVLSTGLNTDEDVPPLLSSFGPNRMDFELPTFAEQFIERALAPMFVFQLFAVLLMCLNDYWYYGLMTISFLVVFECIVVKQQQHNLSRIKSMGNKPFEIHVYRDRKWRKILSVDMLPGDICSVGRSQSLASLSETAGVIPCDLLLLRGSCVVDESMLTGESIPVTKEPVEQLNDVTMRLDPSIHDKLHVLHGGTRIIQHTSSTRGTLKPPNSGCVAYVLRTGFASQQGGLLKTMLFNVNKATANNAETFMFIGFLLIFAIAAAVYVWMEGIKVPDQNKYRLFIGCVMIVTDVIPPELSVELSNAVNNSLFALAKLGVYCTEPFRIPFAGRVDVCCFDKTGTLTSDEVVVDGIAYEGGSSTQIVTRDKAKEVSVDILSVCHSLVNIEGHIMGDPIEIAALNWINYVLNNRGDIVSRADRKSCKVHVRHSFSSTLGRMSVIASVENHSKNSRKTICAVKGSPEKLKSMFRTIPDGYDMVCAELAMRGRRILALAYKDVSDITYGKLSREEVERDLTFAGFIVIDCPLKKETPQVINEIKGSSHHIKMITGDNPLTACHVARQLKLCSNDGSMILLARDDENGEWCWKLLGSADVKIPCKEIVHHYKRFDLCLTGDALTHLDMNVSTELRKTIIRKTLVFARTTPKQKEVILKTLKDQGLVTLMCGDGTNDVGALKRADVGIALASSISASDRASKEAASNAVKERRHKSLRDRMESLEEENVALPSLGDASIASPFFSVSASPNAVTNIIKQGRCTLVTTLQIFKIVALNALIVAYGRSVLYLAGVKFSDAQSTLEGLFVASCFLAISRAKPLETLSRDRPVSNIFNIYTLSTVLAQSSIHLYTLISLADSAKRWMPSRSDIAVDLDGSFEPSLVNSTVFVTMLMLQVSNFAVNYKGKPFMVSLQNNKPLRVTLSLASAVVLMVVYGWIPPFNQYFQVDDFPRQLRSRFLSMIMLDLAGSFSVDRILYKLFGGRHSAKAL